MTLAGTDAELTRHPQHRVRGFALGAVLHIPDRDTPSRPGNSVGGPF